MNRKVMRHFKSLLPGFAAGLLLALPAAAQTVTNTPATAIETFEQQTGTVIIKGFSLVGTIAVGDGVISVRAKESSDADSGQKMDGLAIGWSGSGKGHPTPRGFMVADYDELDSFISGLNYISNVTSNVTPMSGFDVSYTTKSGIRIIAHSDQRHGNINVFLQLGDWAKIQLDAGQLAQLKNLVTQAKATLDSLK